MLLVAARFKNTGSISLTAFVHHLFACLEYGKACVLNNITCTYF